MRPVTWLRAASLLTLFHAVVHTIGGVYGAPPPGPGEIAVAAMKANTFVVMGHTRSFWRFYHGMGIAVAIFLTIEALVFWLLGNIVRDSDVDLRDVLVAFVVGYLALAVSSLRYFFAPPVIVEALIAGCLVMAILSIRRQPASHQGR